MAKLYYDKDADLSLLKGRTIGLLGLALLRYRRRRPSAGTSS